MSAHRDDFEVRAQEISEYFKFLETVDSTENSDLLKTLKANGFLLIYNVMESAMRSSIEAIYDHFKVKQISFDSFRGEVKCAILLDLKKRKFTKDSFISSIATEVAAMSFDAEDLFSGNIDGRKIGQVAIAYGIELPSAKRDELLVVKTNRNDLAHGHKSFSDVGRDYDVLRMQTIWKEVHAYLNLVIRSVETYIADGHYLDRSHPAQ